MKYSWKAILIPSVIGYALLYFVPNPWIPGLFFTLVVIAQSSNSVIGGPVGGLVVDEDWQKTGERKYGYINALGSLITKPSNGVRALIFGAILTHYGYDGTLETQSARTVEGLRLATSVIPAAASLLVVIVIILFFPYNRKRGDEIVNQRTEMEEQAKLELAGQEIMDVA